MAPIPLVAGNWKMHGLGPDLAEIEAIAAGLTEGGPEAMICPPATLIQQAALGVAALPLKIGAQDCHAEAKGAHTGDISAEMLADAGAEAVILGHSERRQSHGETDGIVAAKVGAAWRAGLTPILCVGETAEERAAGRALTVAATQLAGSLPGSGAGPLVVAYEPVWAIGTGRVPTPDEIAEMHAGLRDALAQIGDVERAARTRILYGGSVKPANAAAIAAIPGVDGALVGGASLAAADFLAIVAAFDGAAA